MTSDDLVLTASNEHTAARLELATEAGGRIRQITIERGEHIALLLADPPGDRAAWSSGWGSFPMAPWVGRIRNGRLTFEGRDIRLDLNHSDGAPGEIGGGPIVPAQQAPDHIGPDQERRHAIHGTTFTRPWTVDRVEPDRCEIHCDLVGALGWPFAGTARQRLHLHHDRVELELSVTADESSRFPASIGWHPWFAKPERLDFHPSAMYLRDEVGLPTGITVAPPAPPWDDCFLNEQPVTLHYDRALGSAVTVSSDCDHWVVYDHPAHATCVEPQSGPPDAATIRPEIVDFSNPLTRTMTISW